jgi:hypothetical protein
VGGGLTVSTTVFGSTLGERGFRLNFGAGGRLELLREEVFEKEYWRDWAGEKSVALKAMWVVGVEEAAYWVRFRHETACRQLLG